MSARIVSTLELAQRLEKVEAANQVAFVEAHRAHVAGSTAASQAVGSGQAAYVTPDSPLTQIFGLGLDGPVPDSDLDILEDFYRSRQAAVNVEVCHFADAGLPQQLVARGYQISEQSVVLARRLDTRSGPPHSNARVVRVRAEELSTFARVVALGFDEEGHHVDALVELFEVWFYQEGALWLGALVEGEAAAGGSAVLRDGVAMLGGASTLPRFRGRGLQTELALARLAIGAEQGCDIAAVSTMLGTPSQRNMQRLGFEIVYPRTKLTRHW